MSESEQSAAPSNECLSALMDGAVDADGVLNACRAWRHDEQSRATWHTYHLIGDVLRTEELARPAGHDAAFLQGFRARLAQEPVVLAPTPTESPAMSTHDVGISGIVVNFPKTATVDSPPQRRHRLRRWSAPVGMAAGVALVAGAVFMNRPASEAITLADLTSTPSSAASAAPIVVMDARQANDAQLVRYFNTHKQFSGAPVEAPPSYLRNANYEQSLTPGR